MAMTAEQYTQQAQIVNGNIQDNPNLPSSPVPALNAKLKTNEKQSLIKAINEIFASLATTSSTAFAYINQIIPVIGDWVSDPTLKTEMEKIGPNILSAIKALNDSFSSYYSKTELNTLLAASLVKFPVVTALPADATVGSGYILEEGTNRSACFCVAVNAGVPSFAQFALTPVV